MLSFCSNNEHTEVYTWGLDILNKEELSNSYQGKNTCIPRVLALKMTIKQISCNDEHIAFIAQNGKIYTMGSNLHGRLGIGNRGLKATSTPCLVENLAKYRAKKVSCGAAHTIALLENGELFAWGNGKSGQLGLGNTNNYYSPQLITFSNNQNGKTLHIICIDVDCGFNHSAVISDKGDLFIFGSGESGQLGTGKFEKELLPCYIPFDYNVKEICCGNAHSLALLENNSVYATGDNSFGQLGIGNKINLRIFTKIHSLGDANIQKIYARNGSAAISKNGELYVWGIKFFPEQLIPQKILDSSTSFKEICLGSNFCCASDSKGFVYSWGENRDGELGLGDYEKRRFPTPLLLLKDKQITNIVCGNGFVLALGKNRKNVEKLEESAPANLIGKNTDIRRTLRAVLDKNIDRVSNEEFEMNSTENKNLKLNRSLFEEKSDNSRISIHLENSKSVLFTASDDNNPQQNDELPDSDTNRVQLIEEKVLNIHDCTENSLNNLIRTNDNDTYICRSRRLEGTERIKIKSSYPRTSLENKGNGPYKIKYKINGSNISESFTKSTSNSTSDNLGFHPYCDRDSYSLLENNKTHKKPNSSSIEKLLDQSYTISKEPKRMTDTPTNKTNKKDVEYKFQTQYEKIKNKNEINSHFFTTEEGFQNSVSKKRDRELKVSDITNEISKVKYSHEQEHIPYHDRYEKVMSNENYEKLLHNLKDINGHIDGKNAEIHTLNKESRQHPCFYRIQKKSNTHDSMQLNTQFCSKSKKNKMRNYIDSIDEMLDRSFCNDDFINNNHYDSKIIDLNHQSFDQKNNFIHHFNSPKKANIFHHVSKSTCNTINTTNQKQSKIFPKFRSNEIKLEPFLNSVISDKEMDTVILEDRYNEEEILKENVNLKKWIAILKHKLNKINQEKAEEQKDRNVMYKASIDRLENLIEKYEFILQKAQEKMELHKQKEPDSSMINLKSSISGNEHIIRHLNKMAQVLESQDNIPYNNNYYSKEVQEESTKSKELYENMIEHLAKEYERQIESYMDIINKKDKDIGELKRSNDVVHKTIEKLTKSLKELTKIHKRNQKKLDSFEVLCQIYEKALADIRIQNEDLKDKGLNIAGNSILNEIKRAADKLKFSENILLSKEVSPMNHDEKFIINKVTIGDKNTKLDFVNKPNKNSYYTFASVSDEDDNKENKVSLNIHQQFAKEPHYSYEKQLMNTNFGTFSNLNFLSTNSDIDKFNKKDSLSDSNYDISQNQSKSGDSPKTPTSYLLKSVNQNFELENKKEVQDNLDINFKKSGTNTDNTDYNKEIKNTLKSFSLNLKGCSNNLASKYQTSLLQIETKKVINSNQASPLHEAFHEAEENINITNNSKYQRSFNYCSNKHCEDDRVIVKPPISTKEYLKLDSQNFINNLDNNHGEIFNLANISQNESNSVSTDVRYNCKNQINEKISFPNSDQLKNDVLETQNPITTNKFEIFEKYTLNFEKGRMPSSFSNSFSRRNSQDGIDNKDITKLMPIEIPSNNKNKEELESNSQSSIAMSFETFKEQAKLRKSQILQKCLTPCKKNDEDYSKLSFTDCRPILKDLEKNKNALEYRMQEFQKRLKIPGQGMILTKKS